MNITRSKTKITVCRAWVAQAAGVRLNIDEHVATPEVNEPHSVWKVGYGRIVTADSVTGNRSARVESR